jgi:hypothetical protein
MASGCGRVLCRHRRRVLTVDQATAKRPNRSRLRHRRPSCSVLVSDARSGHERDPLRHVVDSVVPALALAVQSRSPHAGHVDRQRLLKGLDQARRLDRGGVDALTGRF